MLLSPAPAPKDLSVDLLVGGIIIFFMWVKKTAKKNKECGFLKLTIRRDLI